MVLFIDILFAAASVAAPPAPGMSVIGAAHAGAHCPATPMSLARELGKGVPRAVPLNKLPPAQTFMAVDRRVDGCPAPLTMVRYRSGAHRRSH